MGMGGGTGLGGYGIVAELRVNPRAHNPNFGAGLTYENPLVINNGDLLRGSLTGLLIKGIPSIVRENPLTSFGGEEKIGWVGEQTESGATVLTTGKYQGKKAMMWLNIPIEKEKILPGKARIGLIYDEDHINYDALANKFVEVTR